MCIRDRSRVVRCCPPHSQPRALRHTTVRHHRNRPVCRADAAQFYTIYANECQSAGSALRLTARAPSRARLRAVGQAPRAGLVLVEVGVRHVERHSRLRPPDELAALHALLNDGPRHADVRHAADAVARELAADDEAQPPAQRGDDEGARLLLREAVICGVTLNDLMTCYHALSPRVTSPARMNYSRCVRPAAGRF